MARGREGNESEVSLKLQKEGISREQEWPTEPDMSREMASKEIYWIWRNPWFGLSDTGFWENNE